MSVLVNNKINRLARLLRNKSSVEFKHDGLFYEIFESADSGYIVNVYSSDERDEYREYLEEHNFDGGLCSGSARDAVEFMLIIYT